MKKLPILLALLFVIPACLFAQSSEAPSQRVGLFGNVDAALNTGSFSGLPGVANCCPEFTGGIDIGWLAGLTYIKPFDTEWSLHVRLHYGTFGGNFMTSETQPTIGPGGVSETATIQHDLSTSFSQVSIEPLAGYQVVDDLNLLGGVTVGYILSSTFSQKETLVTPVDAVFANQSRERNIIEGDIPNSSALGFGITVGASYDIALNADRTVFLSPEVLFTFSPIPAVQDISYNIHHLRAGLALSFVPPALSDSLYGQELYEFARTVDAPTAVSPTNAFVSKVSATGVSADGSRTGAVNSIRVEEFASTRTRPVLPYVFFNESSYSIPDRYYDLNSDQRDEFSMDNFYNLDPLVTYHHLLNIIGKRMSDNPSSTITLTGHATPEERGGDDLAQARANEVKRYLTSNWGVESERIQVVWKGLPAKPSNMEHAEGQAENQRVEIASNDPTILAPSDFIRYDARHHTFCYSLQHQYRP